MKSCTRMGRTYLDTYTDKNIDLLTERNFKSHIRILLQNLVSILDLARIGL